MKSFWEFLSFWVSAQNQYKRLKDDEEKRPKSVRLGVASIIYTIVGLAIFVFSAWGFIACLNNLQNEVIVTFIGLIVCGALAVVGLIRGLVEALVYWIYQLSLNKKPIGFVALGIWILAVIGAIIAVILLLGII